MVGQLFDYGVAMIVVYNEIRLSRRKNNKKSPAVTDRGGPYSTK